MHIAHLLLYTVDKFLTVLVLSKALITSRHRTKNYNPENHVVAKTSAYEPFS